MKRSLAKAHMGLKKLILGKTAALFFYILPSKPKSNPKKKKLEIKLINEM